MFQIFKKINLNKVANKFKFKNESLMFIISNNEERNDANFFIYILNTFNFQISLQGAVLF